MLCVPCVPYFLNFRKDNAMGYQKAQENARRIDELEKQVAANGVIIQELDRKLDLKKSAWKTNALNANLSVKND